MTDESTEISAILEAISEERAFILARQASPMAETDEVQRAWYMPERFADVALRILKEFGSADNYQQAPDRPKYSVENPSIGKGRRLEGTWRVVSVRHFDLDGQPTVVQTLRQGLAESFNADEIDLLDKHEIADTFFHANIILRNIDPEKAEDVRAALQAWFPRSDFQIAGIEFSGSWECCHSEFRITEEGSAEVRAFIVSETMLVRGFRQYDTHLHSDTRIILNVPGRVINNFVSTYEELGNDVSAQIDANGRATVIIDDVSPRKITIADVKIEESVLQTEKVTLYLSEDRDQLGKLADTIGTQAKLYRQGVPTALSNGRFIVAAYERTAKQFSATDLKRFVGLLHEETQNVHRGYTTSQLKDYLDGLEADVGEVYSTGEVMVDETGALGVRVYKRVSSEYTFPEFVSLISYTRRILSQPIENARDVPDLGEAAEGERKRIILRGINEDATLSLIKETETRLFREAAIVFETYESVPETRTVTVNYNKPKSSIETDLEQTRGIIRRRRLDLDPEFQTADEELEQIVEHNIEVQFDRTATRRIRRTETLKTAAEELESLPSPPPKGYRYDQAVDLTRSGLYRIRKVVEERRKVDDEAEYDQSDDAFSHVREQIKLGQTSLVLSASQGERKEALVSYDEDFGTLDIRVRTYTAKEHDSDEVTVSDNLQETRKVIIRRGKKTPDVTPPSDTESYVVPSVDVERDGTYTTRVLGFKPKPGCLYLRVKDGDTVAIHQIAWAQPDLAQMIGSIQYRINQALWQNPWTPFDGYRGDTRIVYLRHDPDTDRWYWHVVVDEIPNVAYGNRDATYQTRKVLYRRVFDSDTQQYKDQRREVKFSVTLKYVTRLEDALEALGDASSDLDPSSRIIEVGSGRYLVRLVLLVDEGQWEDEE